MADKKPKCPHCKKGLEYLDYMAETRTYGRFRGYYTDIAEETNGEVKYSCPHCGAELADNEQEAAGVMRC